MKAMINKQDGMSLKQSLLEFSPTMLVASNDRAYESPQKKLSAVLRLSSSALFGIDAWKRLPAQLLSRLRENEEDPLLLSLRRESNFAKVGKWLKPLKSSLDSLEKTTIGHDGSILSILAVSDGRVVTCSSDMTLRICNATTGDCVSVLNGHRGPMVG